MFFRQEIAAGRLLQPFARDQRDYWLAYPTVHRGNTRIQAFRRWLLEEVQP